MGSGPTIAETATPTKTGEVVGTKITYDQAVPSTQAELICAPFNVPFYLGTHAMATGPGSGLYLGAEEPHPALNMAREYGFDASPSKFGDPGAYFPYDKRFDSIGSMTWGPPAENKNFGEFSEPDYPWGKTGLDPIRRLLFSRFEQGSFSPKISGWSPIDFVKGPLYKMPADSYKVAGGALSVKPEYDPNKGFLFKEALYISGWNVPLVKLYLLAYGKNKTSIGDLSFMNNKSFIDATFKVNKPFVEVAYGKSMGEETGLSDPVKVNAHYNFYLQPYEGITKGLSMVTGPNSKTPGTNIFLPEVMLPNLYILMSNMGKETQDTKKFKHLDQWLYARKFATAQKEWAWKYQAGHSKGAPAARALEIAKVWTESGVNDYLNNVAMHLKAVANQGKLAPMNTTNFLVDSKKYHTTGISAYKIKDFMDEADKIKKFFPMYTDIEIPASNSGYIGKILYESNFFDQFMQIMIAGLYPRNKEVLSSHMRNTNFVGSAIIKKDSSLQAAVSPFGGAALADSTVVSKMKTTLYYDSLIKLWLNDILQQSSMPDFDAYSTAGGSGDEVAHTSTLAYMKKLDPRIKSKFIKPIIFGKKKSSSVKFINNLKWLAMKKKINAFIREKTRGVKEIYEGEMAHSEVLFYEIAKFHKDTASFVQNIFLPNVPGMDVLKYVDTQVKFDNEYYYQIYAHTFVIGTQYEMITKTIGPGFNSWPIDPDNQLKFPLSYKYKPSVYLMRVPYYNTNVTMSDAISLPKGFNIFKAKGEDDSQQISFQVKGHQEMHPEKLESTIIFDNPPVFPDIVFLPLYGEKNKILLNANFNAGEYDLEPVLIGGEETIYLDKIRKNQEKLTGPITFKSDDFCGQIEVLRIDKKPFKYADFAPTKNTRVAILGGSSAFGFVDDTIKPNKDYYYIARAKDVHGSYSNPSPVYHAKIVAKDGEAPYTIFNMFFIEEVVDKKQTINKSLMKYIRIQPSFAQSYLDSDSISANGAAAQVTEAKLKDNIGLDTAKASCVFGRNFKFRFTSKKTGRKFDLNLSVKNPFLTPGEDLATEGATDEYSSGKC